MFGTVFTDHMLTVEWSLEEGWQKPHIQPFGNLSIHPGCSALHYAVQVCPRHLCGYASNKIIWLPQLMISVYLCLNVNAYCVQLFEGMKAYRGPDNKVRLFRPMMNMNRMQKSAHRACLPVRLTSLPSLLHHIQYIIKIATLNCSSVSNFLWLSVEFWWCRVVGVHQEVGGGGSGLGSPFRLCQFVHPSHLPGHRGYSYTKPSFLQ